ncbi:MAG: CvpA family protein, partial [Oscillospiraceae bacterium]
MAALVIDIIVLLIMFFVVYKGFKKGFLYTIIMIIGCILSIFIASKLSVITTNFVYDKYFGENVVNTVNNSSIINSAKELTQEVFDAIPKCESLINKYLGGELETENAFAKILNSEQLGQDASNLIVKPIL